ncbi:MAG: hypothetical protein U0794_02505 [Isosphaeraceae bacterium]
MVLDPHAVLPEGAVVEVVVVSEPPASRDPAVPTLAQRYAPAIGIVEGLPPDLGTLHDHTVSAASRPGHE